MVNEVLEQPTINTPEEEHESSSSMPEVSAYDSVKEYSKDQSAEERSALAAQLRLRRTIYQTSRTELRLQTETFGQERETLRARAELALVKIQETRVALDNLKTARVGVLTGAVSMMKQFMHRGEIQAQTASMRTQEEEIAEVQQRQIELDQILAELSAQIEDDTELTAVHNELENFYAAENQSWQEYEADRRAGNVTELMKNHNVLFVHGISRFTPDANSPLQSSADVEDKFRIVLGLEPAISTSTISPGDGRESYWASQGFILAGGTVTEAHRRDAATKPHGLASRSSMYSTNNIPIVEQISKAIQLRDNQGSLIKYNELVVEHPKPSALYVTLDNTPNNYNPYDEARSNMPEIAEKLGLPLVVIQNGKPFRAVYDTESKLLTAGDPVPVEELQQPSQIDNRQREEILADIFENSPFKPETPEYGEISARDQGRCAYLDITLAQPDSYVDEPITIESLDGLRRTYRQDNRKIVRDTTYYSRDALGDVTRSHSLQYERDLQSEFAYITPHQTLKVGKAAQENPNSYINSFDTVLNDLHQEMNTSLQQSVNDHSRQAKTMQIYQRFFREIATHLYGFSQEAEARGDRSVAEAARAVANREYPLQQIEEMLERRTDDHGHFRVTINDFPELKRRQKRSNTV